MAKISEQLEIKNRRSNKIWKIIGITVLTIEILDALLIVFNVMVHRSFSGSGIETVETKIYEVAVKNSDIDESGR